MKNNINLNKANLSPSGIITVFADCGWDYTYVMKKNGQYPLKPNFSSPGFKGANQAVAASRAGAKVFIISLVGADKTGEKTIANLKTQAVETSRIKVLEGVPSGCFDIRVNCSGENFTAGNSEITRFFTKEMVNENADLIKKSRFVITNSLLPKNVLVHLINFCFKNKIDVIFTPCPEGGFSIKKDLIFLQKVKYIFANEDESLKLTGAKDIANAMRMLPNLVLTKGAQGVFFTENKEVKTLAAIPAKKIVDTTGAGDTLCGFFAAGMADGLDFTTSLKKGIIAATLKIAGRGAQISMPTKKTVDKIYKKTF